MKYEGLKFEVWDVGGQINLRPYWKNYFPETDCVIFVVDSTDRKRMETVKNEIMYLDSQSELENVPFCICANKQDLVDKALSEFDVSDINDTRFHNYISFILLLYLSMLFLYLD